MNPTSRRGFLQRSAAASAAFVGANLGLSPWLRAAGANDDIRLAVVGVGSRVKIGGMGRNEIRSFRQVPGVRIVALCDVDEANLGPEVESFQTRNEQVAAYTDVRKLLESKDVDGVVVTTPNHWHALVTIWACQAGKDVYVQKPASYNIFEGRKMVEAARKYNRIVQCPNGSRVPNGHAEALDYVRQGNLGQVVMVRHVHFSPRCSIGKVSGPQPIPSTLDYGLWSGPAPILPLARENLHYDWHWQWNYGNGELGNWGIHHLDGCRMFVGGGLPRHVISIGGRFGYEDDGQTPNTLIVYFDYQPAPVLSEFRSLPKDKSFLANAVVGKDSWGANAMDSYQGIPVGKVIHCEHGYVISTINSHAAFDTQRPGDPEVPADHPRSEPQLHRGRTQPPRERPGERRAARAPLGRAGPPGQYFAPRWQDAAGRRDPPAHRRQPGTVRRLSAVPGPPVGQRCGPRQDARHAGGDVDFRSGHGAFRRRVQPSGKPARLPGISGTVCGAGTGMSATGVKWAASRRRPEPTAENRIAVPWKLTM